MRTVVIQVSIIIAISATFARAVKAEDNAVHYVTEDHLVPINVSVDETLRALIESKMFLTPANCALVLIRPPEEGETAAAVYSRQVGGATTFYVTLTRAERNMDMAFAVSGGLPEDVRKIQIKRCDTMIPKSTAVAIRAAWAGMLKRAKKPNVYERPTLHRKEFEFSLGQGDATNLVVGLPNKGGKFVSRMVRLAEALTSYCDLPKGERDSRARELERQAKALTANLPERRGN